MVNKEETIQQASKGYIKDFYNNTMYLTRDKNNFGSLPSFDRQKALNAIRKDSTVQTTVTTLVDKTLENGYKFSADDGKSRLDEFKIISKKVNFDRILRNILTQIYGYQNAFIENVKDGNSKIKELHVLETTQTEPQVDIHGKIIGYIQNIPITENLSMSGDNVPTWTPDEITHIKVNTLTNSPWSDLDIERIYIFVELKQYIYKYVSWLFATNQFRNFYNIKDASEDAIKDFLSYVRKGNDDILMPLIAEGEIQNQILRDFKDGTNILSWVDKCDVNIMNLMQVPPIAGGETGESNRSSADKQDQMLATRIKSIQKLLKDYFENDLFPKMGFDKIKIEWNPLLKTDLSKLLENAERMKNMGFDIKKIEEYLKIEGFPVEGKLFDREIIDINKQSLNTKSEDMYPSRQRKDSDETSKNIGSGEESTTREEQIAQGYTINYDFSDTKLKFNKYPYLY
jgi:hypothetical protein